MIIQWVGNASSLDDTGEKPTIEALEEASCLEKDFSGILDPTYHSIFSPRGSMFVALQPGQEV